MLNSILLKMNDQYNPILHGYYAKYVAGPAKIGHIGTQNVALFLNFYLQYLLKYKGYYNKIFMPY